MTAEATAVADIDHPALEEHARTLLRSADARGWRISTAESYSGGALSALLTDMEGLSHLFDRGFVVNCDAAKSECLSVDPVLIADKGAVSTEVAAAMAAGALAHSDAELAVAVTGYAGSSGPGEEAGLVYVCVATRDGARRHRTCHFGSIGRAQTRMRAIEAALALAQDVCEQGGG